jgi:glycosyltransferase involved in cell wall biosynthesis
VTVVVVAYNNWPDVELAVQSALCQSHRAVEVIVVDNSSTDATPRELPARFADRIRYVRQPNTRDSGAYNTGMRLARGAFVQFLDGDDLLAPDKLEKQLAAFAADPSAEAVFGDVRTFHTLPGPVQSCDSSPRDRDDMLLAFLERYGNLVIPMVGMLFRRPALERIGPFDETIYCSDVDYELRALWAGCRFRYCEGNPAAFYRVRPGQMSSDRHAMAASQEAIWRKAAGYMTREPYAALARANLAWTMYMLAVRRTGLTVREALRKLDEARAVSAQTVPPLAYLAGVAVILMPWRSLVLDAQWLRGARRAVAQFAGCRPYWET